MATCEFCEREMMTAWGCTAKVYLIGGKPYEPRRHHGEHGEMCGDCNCDHGAYHHQFCDMERCPKCGGQFLSCDCKATILRKADLVREVSA